MTPAASGVGPPAFAGKIQALTFPVGVPTNNESSSFNESASTTLACRGLVRSNLKSSCADLIRASMSSHSGIKRRGWPGQARPRRLLHGSVPDQYRLCVRPDFPRTALRENGNLGLLVATAVGPTPPLSRGVTVGNPKPFWVRLYVLGQIRLMGRSLSLMMEEYNTIVAKLVVL